MESTNPLRRVRDTHREHEPGRHELVSGHDLVGVGSDVDRHGHPEFLDGDAVFVVVVAQAAGHRRDERIVELPAGCLGRRFEVGERGRDGVEVNAQRALVHDRAHRLGDRPHHPARRRGEPGGLPRRSDGFC